MACVLVAGLASPTSVLEFVGIPVMIFNLVRVKNVYRLWWQSLFLPGIALIALFGAWMAISLAWSPDPAQGLDHMGALRWIWIVFVLWPVIDRRRYLIAAYAIGFLAGNAVQVAQALQPVTGLVLFDRMPGRLSGWWDPVVGGSMLCAALGIHLGGAVYGSGRVRWVALAGVAVTLACVVMTGTRGAWIASAMLLALGSLLWIRRAGPRRRLLLPLAILASVALIACAGTAWLLRDSALADRVQRGVEEISLALDEGEYSTETGARIFMNKRALEAFGQHPVRGVGAGGYGQWANAPDPDRRLAHDHAHSAPLHLLATLGGVGALIAIWLIALTLKAGMGVCVQGDDEDRRGLDAFDAGPALALVGLLLAGLFDTIQINAQTAAHMAFLIALCPTYIPNYVPWRIRAARESGR